ncbi:hypothetical protein ACVDFE_24745 [Lentzea chajnantorensis]
MCRYAFAGHDFTAPRRTDDSGWRAVAAALAAGLRYEGFETCGCDRRSGRARQVRGRRLGVADAEALAARAPADLV